MGLLYGSNGSSRKGIRRMQASHDLSHVSAVFDEDNLVACAGLVPVMALAQRAGLGALAGRHLRLKGPGAANAPAKVACLVAGMAAGADSIDDMDLLRHGAMTRLFGGLRAPSTLGVFLRSFTFGHARQLEAVATRFLAALAGRAPLLPGADAITFVDVDDTIKATYGYAKQGAGYGYSGVKGLNALIATASTPTSAPVIVGTRLREGSAASVRGAAKFVADAISAARAAGAGGPEGTAVVIVRADSAYYTADVVAAARRAGGPVLHHRRQQPLGAGGDHHDRRGRLDPDQVPAGGLGRAGRPVGLRRPGRRGPLHRLHLPPQAPAGHREADRAPGPD